MLQLNEVRNLEKIQSTRNPKIKELKKLHKKKYREKQGKYLLEGFHLIEEAVKSKAPVQEILVTQRGIKEWNGWLAKNQEIFLIFVTDEVMRTISESSTPQGILAVLRFEENKRTDLSGGWLLLDNVQDPGNVGTMIRTADAFGLCGVVLGNGTADIYSTKVLRSMQGSNYHLPILSYSLEKLIPLFKEKQFLVYGTELNKETVSSTQIKPPKNYALIVGNEGTGVRRELLSLTDQNIYIPIPGNAESLNVGVAVGIILYQFSL